VDFLTSETRKRLRLQAVKHELELENHYSSQSEHPKADNLRQALYRLPPDRREVLVLSRYEGLSYAEIADVCQITVGAVKVRAHRAMRDLREIFEELERQHEV
jgi:RNA polymerase sigma-70 factor, ECF subfamily